MRPFLCLLIVYNLLFCIGFCAGPIAPFSLVVVRFGGSP